MIKIDELTGKYIVPTFDDFADTALDDPLLYRLMRCFYDGEYLWGDVVAIYAMVLHERVEIMANHIELSEAIRSTPITFKMWK